jgi:CheY-like chemotaxis protein
MRRRILFVDDDPNLVAGLSRALHPLAHEWEVIFATNGDEALTCLQDTPCEVVITDILMPERDGLEVTMALRRSCPAVKIVVMSGGGRWGTMHLLKVATKLGAHGILAKPFSPQQLIEVVQGALQRYDEDHR